MNKQKRMINKILPIIVITIITISFTAPAFAYQGNIEAKQKIENEESSKFHKKNKKNKRGLKIENHELIKTALINKNYIEWKKLIEDNNNPQNERLLSVINESNFERYANAKILSQNGDKNELNQLKKELGLNYNNKK